MSKLASIRKKAWFWFEAIMAVGYLLVGFAILLFKRNNDVGPIYKGLRFFLRHPSYQETLRILRADPGFSEMIRTRYRAEEKTDWSFLQALPEGTLGREFANFMGDAAITQIDRLPDAGAQIDPEIDYMRARLRFTHDIHHVVCGFPASPLGEVQISALYVAQIKSPLNMIVIATGVIKATFWSPEKIPDVIAAVVDGWQLGKEADSLFGMKYEDYWAEPLPAVRERLKIRNTEKASDRRSA
jgi:ubiquinone biosynthesis protein COQ4